MRGNAQNSPRPVCELCGEQTKRTTHLRPGKAGYQCTTVGCPNQFIKTWERPSARHT